MSAKIELHEGPRYNSASAYRITAALFDVDNTLVGNESPDVPTQRFRNAAMSAKGSVTVALASARPLSKTRHIMDYIGAEGLSIVCNGAQIVNSSDGSVVAEWPIAVDTCIALSRELRSLGVIFWINDDGVDYFPSTSDSAAYERQTDIWDAHSPRIFVEDYQPRKPFVINAHDISGQQVNAIEELVAVFGDKEVTTLISHETKQTDGSLLYDLFVVRKQANKKDALAELARLQGMELQNLMAVGDGRNDAVLVGSAGVGVAMGNSAQETLDVATFVAPDCQDDGAAVALEYALKNFTNTARGQQQ